MFVGRGRLGAARLSPRRESHQDSASALLSDPVAGVLVLE